MSAVWKRDTLKTLPGLQRSITFIQTKLLPTIWLLSVSSCLHTAGLVVMLPSCRMQSIKQQNLRALRDVGYWSKNQSVAHRLKNATSAVAHINKLALRLRGWSSKFHYFSICKVRWGQTTFLARSYKLKAARTDYVTIRYESTKPLRP